MATIKGGNHAGIYRIRVDRGALPPKFYIGQAAILRKRRDVHFGMLRLGTHKNYALQSAFVQFGPAAFTFEVLIICERRKETLDAYEQAILDTYDDLSVFNLSRECVGSRLGVAHRSETKAKIGAGNKGKTRSPEHCDAVRQANKRRVVSTETRTKMSVAHRGNKRSLGVRLSDERKAEISAFFKGTKKPPEEIARRLATRRSNAAVRGHY